MEKCVADEDFSEGLTKKEFDETALLVGKIFSDIGKTIEPSVEKFTEVNKDKIIKIAELFKKIQKLNQMRRNEK
jgi:hypothetical protein